MAGQPAEHPSERPKSNRFSVSLFASVVLGAANDVLKLVTSLACFIFRFLRRPPAHLEGLGHAQLNVTQGQLLGQRPHRESVGSAEDGLRPRPAICHSRAGQASGHGLDRLLQPLAATFGAGLPQPDAVGTTLVGGAAHICRLMTGLRTPVFRGNLKHASDGA